MERQYSTKEVSRLLKLSEQRIRIYARAGLVGQHERRAIRRPKMLQFDFRDILVLKMASRLVAEGFASARIQRVLEKVRAQIPKDRPLSGLKIFSAGERILVRIDGRTWEPETGQFQLLMDSGGEGAEAPEQMALLAIPEITQAANEEYDDGGYLAEDDDDQDNLGAAQGWFELAVSLEDDEPHKAYEAYLRTLACNPEHTEAHINIGSLCSAAGELRRAAAYFRVSIRIDPTHPVAHYNLGVTLHDLGDVASAEPNYRAAIEQDPNFASAHYNLATILEQDGRQTEADTHWRRYRELSDSDN
jgi:tetratricopeptide (TPR) repeat protein